MNEKDLFAFMIKHYQLVDCELYKKESYTEKEPIEDAPFYISVRKEENGIKFISASPFSYVGSHGFCIFHLTREAKVIEIVKKGIVLYNDDGGDYICSIEDLFKVLPMESEHMYELRLYRDPTDKRLPSEYLSYYFNSIKCYIEKLKYESSVLFFYGAKEGMKKYGVFGYAPLYSDINWTFELVEKYKNQIVGWNNLIENGNLFWSEEKIELYYDYIIEKYKEYNYSYRIMSQSKFPIKNFANISCLSWNFLLKHFEELDLFSYISTGNINYDLVILHILSYEIGEKLFWEILLKNPHCIWTIEMFRFVCGSDDGCELLLQMDEKRRISIYNFICNSNDVYLFNSDFLSILKEGKLRYGYSKDFNIENVRKNSVLWDEVVFDKFNKHGILFEQKGEIKTVWNYFAENKYVELTYELCKYLLNIEITMGSFFDKEYTEVIGWTEYGRYSYKTNGLKVFRNKHIKNEHELEKIVADKKLLSAMFTYDYFNQDVVDYMMKLLFQNFAIEDWRETINFILNKNQHNYVDLGLSVYWATQNIGANNSLEYGENFIWGEPYSDLDIDEEECYKQAWGEDMSQFTNKDRDSKYYDTTDIAKTRFDAASMNWGINWRMPRANEFQELIDKCTWERVDINSIKAYKITGVNGKHILLPHSYGINYLTSTRWNMYPYIYVFREKTRFHDEIERHAYATERCFIRPVLDKPNNSK